MSSPTLGGEMSTVLKIKGIRKWRVTYDDLNWVIQEKTKNKPPNDWVNRYYFTELEVLFTTLLKLGISEAKLTNFKGILNAYNRKSKAIVDAIHTLGEHFSLAPPESTRIKQVKKSIPKRKKKGK
jgi:hypothetical protein